MRAALDTGRAWDVDDAADHPGLQLVTPPGSLRHLGGSDAAGAGVHAPVSPHSLAAALAELLASLSPAVVPAPLIASIAGVELDTQSTVAWSRRLLEKLAGAAGTGDRGGGGGGASAPVSVSAAHYSVFVYLISFLRELLKPERAAANLLSPQVLAEFCCGCMLGGADGFDEKTKTACLCVLTHFLTTETI